MSTVNFLDGQVFDMYKPHEAVELSDWLPSLTRQEFAEECDINVIMERYAVTGQLPANNAQPFYIDMTSFPPDYQTALHMMMDAEKAFMLLPAQVRREFDNDATKFVEFASDPENLSQMRTWGLAPPEAKPEAAISVPPPSNGPEAKTSQEGS